MRSKPIRWRRDRCKTGKKCWSSESAAYLKLLDVQEQRRREGDERMETRVYLCPYCRKWHLTSLVPKEDERPR